MKITSKGQVTIPQAVREQARLLPHSEVSFEVLPNGDVLMRAVKPATSHVRRAFERVRGSANADGFKNLDTDAFMQWLRGPAQ
jgi:bifunctional DNA-binding transcriptional regulator/antitoxin component of YhaV-PrlF toxin-antitoxin module